MNQTTRKQIRIEKEKVLKYKKAKQRKNLTTTMVIGLTSYGALATTAAHAIETETSDSTNQVETQKNITPEQKKEFIKTINDKLTELTKSSKIKTDTNRSTLIAYAIQRSNWGQESYAKNTQNNTYALPTLDNRTDFTFEQAIQTNGDLATYKNLDDNIIDFIKLEKEQKIKEDSTLNKELKQIIEDNNLIDYDNNIQTYIVQKDDTLGQIAQKFNVSIYSIVNENNIDNDLIIYIGQELKIKNGDPIVEEPEIEDVETNSEYESTPETDETEDISETNSDEYDLNYTVEMNEPAIIDHSQSNRPLESENVQNDDETTNISEDTEENNQEENNSIDTPNETPTQPEQNETITDNTTENNNQNQNTNQRDAVLTEAQKHLGVPYLWGGKTPNGFDCSGFTQYVYQQATGINIGGWTVPQEDAGQIISVSDAQPGDLYFWGAKGNTTHVAIATGNGDYIHAPTEGQNVSYGSVKYYTPSFAVRVL